jgi:hypothetical protein
MVKNKINSDNFNFNINNILNNIEEYNYTIKDLKINDLIPNVIENVIILNSGKPEIHLPHDMSGLSLKNWMNGRGGVFFNDVKKKTNGNYILLQGDEKRFIARIIEDNELYDFNICNLIDGKIKDKPYMILKKLSENEKLTTTARPIFNESEEIDHDPKIIYVNTNDEEISDTPDNNNIKLFD